jgi:hypothetical protein
VGAGFERGCAADLISRKTGGRDRRATHPLGGFPARALIQNNTAKEFFSSLLGPAGDNNKSHLPAITDNDWPSATASLFLQFCKDSRITSNHASNGRGAC